MHHKGIGGKRDAASFNINDGLIVQPVQNRILQVRQKAAPDEP